MMGVPEAPPGEGIVLVLSWCFAIALSLGALTALMWAPAPARIVRWVLVAAAVLVQVVFHVMAPPRSALASAGRLVFLWPALVIAVLAGAAWWWRDDRRVADVITGDA
jgi:hypothetical protein